MICLYQSSVNIHIYVKQEMWAICASEMFLRTLCYSFFDLLQLSLICEDLIYSVLVLDAMTYNNETCAIKIKMLFLLMTMFVSVFEFPLEVLVCSEEMSKNRYHFVIVYFISILKFRNRGTKNDLLPGFPSGK